MYYFSDYAGINIKGHANFDFVDIRLNKDNLVFIDPILLELAPDNWSKNATKLVHSYFSSCYHFFRNDEMGKISDLFAHAHEQNATKLGYGNGRNGKGKTEKGLKESWENFGLLIREISTINKAIDTPIFVKNFGKDCMSDLLTNILHEPLNEFTASQIKKHNLLLATKSKIFWTWSIKEQTWIQVERKSWLYEGKELLLVPKWIVRPNYIFGIEQYLLSTIAEEVKDEKGLKDMGNKEVVNNYFKPEKYKKTIEYTKVHSNVLEKYHQHVIKCYKKKGNRITDKKLDKIIYKK